MGMMLLRREWLRPTNKKAVEVFYRDVIYVTCVCYHRLTQLPAVAVLSIETDKYCSECKRTTYHRDTVTPKAKRHHIAPFFLLFIKVYANIKYVIVKIRHIVLKRARVVELADSLDSGSSAHYGRAGSSPAPRTTL